MGAGKGGDGGGEEAAAPEPVVLKMELHCAGCAHKVKKAIRRVPGVVSIVADAAANRVVVAGTADAAALKARLEAKTNKAVEIVSAGTGAKKPAAEPNHGGAGEKNASPSPKEEKEKEKEKKQPPEEKKPKEETVLLKINLHCDGCADRIRRRIYKIKGVKDVVMDGNAKNEVKVRGTMDIPAMVSYLKQKLNRDVEAVAPAPAKKDGGDGGEKDKGVDGGDKNKGAAAAPGGGDDDKKDKGKGIDVSSSSASSTAAAAAFMAAPAGPSTYHVAPPQGYVAYQQGPPPPAAASYYSPYSYPYPYYGGNADGMGHANPGAATYYPYQHQPDGSQHHQQQPYPPEPYRFDMAPAPQFFSDENPNACSVM